MKRILSAVILLLLAGAIPAGAEETIQLYLAAADWGVELPGAALVADPAASGKTGTTLKLQASSPVNDLFLTAYIEPAEGEGGSGQARSVYFERMKEAPMKMSDVKTCERGPLAILEYTWLEVEGRKLNQRHVHVYLAHGGSWVDIHLSLTGYTEEKQPLFDQFVEGVRLVERKESDLTSAEFLLLGIQAAGQGRCEEADEHFQRALAINRVKTQMKKEDYAGMLGSLGICYGKAGEQQKAVSALQTAIGQDPKYPNLHYHLARAYAQLGEEEKALTELAATSEKMGARPQDQVPDPLDDSAFESMKKNPEFKKIARKIAREIRKQENKARMLENRLNPSEEDDSDDVYPVPPPE